MKKKTHTIPSAFADDLARYELIRLYLEDDAFSTELNSLQRQYQDDIVDFLQSDGKDALIESSDMQSTECFETYELNDYPEYQKVLECVRNIGRAENRCLTEKKETFINVLPSIFPHEHAKLFVEISVALEMLTTRFGFDYYFAIPRLLADMVTSVSIQIVQDYGWKLSEDDFSNLKLTSYESIAKSTGQKPLIIVLDALVIMYQTEREILAHVKEQLHGYKEKLKNIGFELDSKDQMEKQIGWVFAQKRYGLSAKEILNSEFLGGPAVDYHHISDTIRDWDDRLSFKHIYLGPTVKKRDD